jgi:hypothetical protein
MQIVVSPDSWSCVIAHSESEITLNICAVRKKHILLRNYYLCELLIHTNERLFVTPCMLQSWRFHGIHDSRQFPVLTNRVLFLAIWFAHFGIVARSLRNTLTRHPAWRIRTADTTSTSKAPLRRSHISLLLMNLQGGKHRTTYCIIYYF